LIQSLFLKSETTVEDESEDIEVTGPIVLNLYASIDTEDTNWIVTLKDVARKDWKPY